jgi:hypothetical protein
MSFMRTPDERLRGSLIIPWQVWDCQKARDQERLLTAVNFRPSAVSRGSYLPRLRDPLIWMVPQTRFSPVSLPSHSPPWSATAASGNPAVDLAWDQIV